VADPAWGAKLTGKVGANNLGVFVARDRINNLLIPSNQFSRIDSLEQEVTGSVLRYSRDVGRSSAVGAIYTGREADGYHNRVAGLDTVIQLASADSIDIQFLHSDTLYPEEVRERQQQSHNAFAGEAFLAEYRHNTRHWYWSASFEDFSPDFRADFGFVPRVDTRTVDGDFGRTWWSDRSSRWVSFQLGGGYERTIDYDGTLTDETIKLDLWYRGPLQTSVFFVPSMNKEFYNGVTFDLARAFFNSEIQPSGTVKLRLSGVLGDEIDSFNTQKGDLLNLRPGMELKLGRHINLDLSHSFQRLDVDGGRLFEENLTEARLYYYHNVRTLVRLITQLRTIDRNPDLFPSSVEPELNRLFLQFLFSYKVNPRTVFFAGYSDNYNGLQNVSLTRTGRTFFLKIGYAWTM